jgi:hypothetical protein
MGNATASRSGGMRFVASWFDSTAVFIFARHNGFRGNTMRNGGTELITNFSNPDRYVRR